MVKSLCAALLLCALAGEARGDAALDQARALLRDLQYEEAYPLLLESWRSGDHGPEELEEVFQLLGELAVPLGKGDAARDHFAHLLALKPDTRLEEGTSPKVIAPFRKARALLGGRALEAIHRVSSRRILVEVRSDPLGMVAGARAIIRGAGAPRTVEVKGRERIEILLPAAGRLSIALAVIDRHGNRILVLASGDDAVVVAPPAPEARPVAAADPARPAAPPSDRPGRPLYARWIAWAGLSAGFVAVGGWFGLRARNAQDDLDRLIQSSGEHEASRALRTERRLRRDVDFANVSFGAAAACAIVSAVLAVTADRDRDATRGPSVSPRASPDGAGAVLEIPF